MRFVKICILMLCTVHAHSQCKTFRLTAKGDTINCTDMSGWKQGKWKVQTPALRGEPGFDEEGVFLNDQREGVWRKFNLMGDMTAVENYKWGQKNGLCRYYTMSGLEHEENWMAVNPKKKYDTIDVQDVHDQNKYEKTVVKADGNALRHGTWKYYYPSTHQLYRIENYYLDRLLEPGEEHGPVTGGNVKIADTTASKKIKPKEVLDFEKKNAGKKPIKIRDGRTGG